jgi:hypothetical protein
MGNLIVDGSAAGRRAGLGTGAHRRAVPGPGLVLHPGLAVRGAGEPRSGGLGSSLDDFVAADEQAGGSPVDRAALRWWLVLGTLGWG